MLTPRRAAFAADEAFEFGFEVLEFFPAALGFAPVR
jgi:hypothetical protein